MDKTRERLLSIEDEWRLVCCAVAGILILAIASIVYQLAVMGRLS